MNSEAIETSGYRIGAVSKLTGIPAETLRVWERRYAVVTPKRSPGGSRVYDRADIARLETIKQLVDGGQTISSVASLPLEVLQQRLKELAKAGQPASLATGDLPVELLLVGSTLPNRLLHDREMMLDWPDSISIGASAESIDLLSDASDGATRRILIVEVATITEEAIETIGNYQADDVILVYNYAETQARASAEHRGWAALRAPVNWPLLLRLCTNSVAARTSHTPKQTDPNQQLLGEDAPKRRFNDRQLARFLAMSPTVRCECPKHVAELIVNLNRFEVYSKQCENRNAEDALLHNYLGAMTGRARSFMEEAMKRLADIEKIPLD